SIDHPGRAGEHQHLIRGGISRGFSPGAAITVLISDASLLHNGIDAAAGMKRGIEHVAGTHTVRLARGLRSDTSFWCSMNRSELTQVVEACLEFSGGHHGLAGIRGCGAERNLGSSRRVGTIQTPTIG